MDTVTLHFTSHPRLLSVVRSAVTAAVAVAGFTGREVDEVCMAVDEACANIIRHSYAGRRDEVIEMECRLGEDRIIVTLRDSGPPFDPAEVGERDLDEVRPGGLGLHLIRQMMDEVEYVPGVERGTELVLTKYRTPIREESNGS